MAVVDHERAREHYAAEWRTEAATDRDKAIAIVLDARRQICDVRVQLSHFDMSLSHKLAPFAAELDARLGALLVAQMDAA